MTIKDKRNKAVYLRKNEGLSYNEISETLGGVPKGTLSYWLSDIPLNKKQVKRLDKLNPAINKKHVCRKKQGQTLTRLWKERRRKFQDQGKQKAGQLDLYLTGCMLYWAEGAKDKNSLKFTNTDLSMMKLFLRFLRECFQVEDRKLAVSCHSHILSESTLAEAEKYWLKELQLPSECLRKGYVEIRIPKRKTVKYPMGICTLQLGNTEILQEIFGSIKQYASIDDNDKWIY